MKWWGPKGFTAPFCEIDFRVGGKFLCCMRTPDGQEGWNAGEYHEIVLHEKIDKFTPCTFPTRRETRLSLRSME